MRRLARRGQYELARDDDVGGDASVGTLPQLHADAVPVCKPPDHVQAHVPGGRGVEHWRAPQPGVDLGEPVCRDADARILNADNHRPVAGAFSAHDDRRALRRLGGGVVQELSEDVAEVVGRQADHLHVRQRRYLCAAVVGDL
jgi:hypothetical protein